jgi:hypothetical protein
MMSTNSMKSELLGQAFPRARSEGPVDMSREAARWKLRTSEFFSLHGRWRQLFETLVLLAVITALQRWLFGAAAFTGLPHPYLLPVLLVSSQYGMSGGLTAAGAASLLYWFGFSTPSAAQDFHAYAGTVAVQPATWLATALVIGGLRSLHIHQFSELADQLATDRRRGHDLACGLERAIAEINGLERRIGTDMRSVAALSRSLADIDLSDWRAAAVSYAELFRVGTGTPTFTIFLKDADGYVPVCAVEEDVIRSSHGVAPLSLATVAEMTRSNAADRAMDLSAESELDTGRHVVAVGPCGGESAPLAVIVCELHPSQDPKQFRRRADELSRALATMLNACLRQVERERA